MITDQCEYDYVSAALSSTVSHTVHTELYGQCVWALGTHMSL